MRIILNVSFFHGRRFLRYNGTLGFYGLIDQENKAFHWLFKTNKLDNHQMLALKCPVADDFSNQHTIQQSTYMVEFRKSFTKFVILIALIW